LQQQLACHSGLPDRLCEVATQLRLRDHIVPAYLLLFLQPDPILGLPQPPLSVLPGRIQSFLRLLAGKARQRSPEPAKDLQTGSALRHRISPLLHRMSTHARGARRDGDDLSEHCPTGQRPADHIIRAPAGRPLPSRRRRRC
jgi:hypothetical protein